jgi:digeranylgeranylglycerophospholipid reductase
VPVPDTRNAVEAFDVIVVGGGPAGLCAAREAARRGAKTILLEQGSEIGSPTRTTGGSFTKDLQELGIPLDFQFQVPRCRFVSPNRCATFEYDEPVLCILDVRGTFQYLAGQAIESGAIVRVATTAVEPVIENGSVVGVVTRDRRGRTSALGAKVVIDASGHRSVLLKRAGVFEGCKRFGVGAEVDLYAPNYDEKEVVLLVGNQVAPAGYAWAAPWGKHRVRVGVGIIHPDSSTNPDDYLQPLIDNGHRFGMNFHGASPIEYHHGLIPSGGLNKQLVGDGIISAGDAAGQPSALVGEGIRWAILAGNLAGSVAAESVRAGDYSRKWLSRYEKVWIGEHGRNLRIAHAINERIARWDDQKWDQKTELLSLLTPLQFMEALKSNFVAKWPLDLVRSHPGLLKEGFRVVLGNLRARV